MSTVELYNTVVTTSENVDYDANHSLFAANISTTQTIRLRNGCTFSGAISLTCATLYADLESFRNMLNSGVILTGVTAFVPLFDIPQKEWGAAVATSGQFLAEGAAENATTNATEANVQIITDQSYVLLNLEARAPATSCTVTMRVGGVSQTLTCSPSSSTDKDRSIAHWVKGNEGDLVSVLIGGVAGGLVRASCGFIGLG